MSKVLRKVTYPTSDGKPMGETPRHRDAMIQAIQTLQDFFADEPSVYVSGNDFLYFNEGHPRDVVSPDTYVVRGVRKRLRDTFMTWKEKGRVPCFVLEVTSKKTAKKDRGSKMARYRDELGVPEYFLFDPRGDWVEERLRGFVLHEREGVRVYDPIPTKKGRFVSRELGLELAVVDDRLRFFLPGEKEPLPTRAERAEAAEAELARLREKIARLEKKKPRKT